MKKVIAIAAIVAVAFPVSETESESWPTTTWPSTQCSQTFPVTGGGTFPVCSWPSWPKG
ncbi:MAG: hypothetical protein IJP75_11735 [Bacteroidaceae bacterium]|nr:hypothetical protein [Bacteroidaceae bacterium]